MRFINSLPLLFSLCVFLGSCKAKKIAQDKYIETVATLIEPKGYHHSHSTETSSGHDYSTFSFLADSAGQKVQVKADYDAGANNFFYHHARTGDMFEVGYRIGNPHKFKAYSNKPYLNPLHTDTVVGKIININPANGVIEFEYSPKVKEHHKIIVLKKWQDIRDSLVTKYPDVKEESKFPVVYNTLDSTKAIMLVYNNEVKKFKPIEKTKRSQTHAERPRVWCLKCWKSGYFSKAYRKSNAMRNRWINGK